MMTRTLIQKLLDTDDVTKQVLVRISVRNLEGSLVSYKYVPVHFVWTYDVAINEIRIDQSAIDLAEEKML